MKVKCENIVRCANAECIHNDDGYSCYHIVVAIGSDGRCALCKPKSIPEVKTITKFSDGTESETTTIIN